MKKISSLSLLLMGFIASGSFVFATPLVVVQTIQKAQNDLTANNPSGAHGVLTVLAPFIPATNTAAHDALNQALADTKAAAGEISYNRASSGNLAIAGANYPTYLAAAQTDLTNLLTALQNN